MAMFLCRWPNGEFSIVSATSKQDAIVLLDEWGNAEQASLTRMPDCMFDFRLGDDGDIELAQIGGATEEFVMKTCYPELEKALLSAEESEAPPQQASEQIRSAVESERTRLWRKQPQAKQAETELGRYIQAQTGAPSVLVNRAVKRAAEKRLDAFQGDGKTPN